MEHHSFAACLGFGDLVDFSSWAILKHFSFGPLNEQEGPSWGEVGHIVNLRWIVVHSLNNQHHSNAEIVVAVVVVALLKVA